MAISLLLSTVCFAQQPATAVKKTSYLAPLLENYFALKDALVKTDGATASAKANSLNALFASLKTESLTSEERAVWVKVKSDLKEDTEHIAETKEVKHQREHFSSLSKNIYALVKVSKSEMPLYYQHCPMYNSGKGADWLSKESVIKNPYYGSQMLTCGKTVETIQ